MVFSSVPPYLDHHNWHHQLHQSNHQGSGGVGGGGDENPNLPLAPPPPPQHGSGGGGGGGEGSIRPGSMVDRARLAKLPLPEPGLNCPRCDSTNTKFCYFNNYSLTQPRHFCKTCRRYWTRGGALRNVPVGGGCRRNKRSSKSRSSKSPSQSGPKSLSVSPPRSSLENMTGSTHQLTHHPASLHLPSFMSSLSQYGGNLSSSSNNIGGFHHQPQMSEMGNFQIGNGGNNLSNILSIGQQGSENNWRVPFLGGFEVPSNNNNNSNNNVFNYENEGVTAEGHNSMVGSAEMNSNKNNININSGLMDNNINPPPVKVEDHMNSRGLNLSRQFLGMLENSSSSNNQQAAWAAAAGNSWADQFPAAGVNTSTTHFL